MVVPISEKERFPVQQVVSSPFDLPLSPPLSSPPPAPTIYFSVDHGATEFSNLGGLYDSCYRHID